MDKYKFGEFIYQKRKKIGLTQEELGRKLGVTNKAVSKWEVGETLPEITMLEPLANLLQVTVDELLTQTEKKEVEKKVKKVSVLLIVITAVSLLITLIAIVSSVAYINYQMNKEDKIIVTMENYQDIISIDSMTNFICDGQTITISSSYLLNDKYHLKDNETLSFKIEFEIDYYYYLENESLGVVSYLEREQEIVLSNDELSKLIQLTLKPKNEITDFKNFKNIVINYNIVECNGVVYK